MGQSAPCHSVSIGLLTEPVCGAPGAQENTPTQNKQKGTSQGRPHSPSLRACIHEPAGNHSVTHPHMPNSATHPHTPKQPIDTCKQTCSTITWTKQSPHPMPVLRWFQAVARPWPHAKQAAASGQEVGQPESPTPTTFNADNMVRVCSALQCPLKASRRAYQLTLRPGATLLQEAQSCCKGPAAAVQQTRLLLLPLPLLLPDRTSTCLGWPSTVSSSVLNTKPAAAHCAWYAHTSLAVCYSVTHTVAYTNSTATVSHRNEQT